MPLGLKLEDLHGRLFIAFMACEEDDGIGIELLRARYYLDRAIEIQVGKDPDMVEPERVEEWPRTEYEYG